MSHDLTITTLPQWVRVCPDCLQIQHGDSTCEEAAEDRAAMRSAFAKLTAHFDRVLAPSTPMADVPATLRGPHWAEAVR